MWTVRHLWPSGARFTFNCYRHHSLLLVRAKDGDDGTFLFSKEGVTQGDPRAMVLDGLALVPLAAYLLKMVPEILSPFYADDSAFFRSCQWDCKSDGNSSEEGTYVRETPLVIPPPFCGDHEHFLVITRFFSCYTEQGSHAFSK